jgi:hypothetical protein
LLGIAAVLGVLSLGAIVFAMRGSGGESAVPLAFDAGPPQAVLDLLDAAAPPAIPALPADTPLGPLAPSTPVSHGGGRHETHDGGTAKEAHDAGGAKEPLPAPIASTPHLFPPGFGGATVPPPPPPQPAGVKPVPFACQQAALMRRAGNVTAYQMLKKACEGEGGQVPL